MRRRRLRFPIALQILALTLATVVVAQAVTVAAVLLMPPSRPPHYSFDQVVGALRDGDPSGGRRPLVRTVAQTLPGEFLDPTVQETATAERIATLLAVQADAVRFVQRDVPRGVIFTTGGGPGGLGAPAPQMPPPPGTGAPSGGGGPGAPPPPGQPPAPAGLSPPGGGMPGGLTEFAVAVRQPDGTWHILQPSAETEWLPRLLLWLFGSLIIVGPLAWWFARRISRPMRQFASAAERLGQNPAEAPLTIAGFAEIGVAAEAFNQMQARLSRYVRDRIGMVGAISHDLRTPLTRIRFKVEAVPADLRRSILDDVEHMEAMIASVLAFVRDVDHAAPRERLDLTSLVSCAVDDLAETGARVALEDDPPILVISGDPVGLRRLIDNLLDNAIKYGREARVSIEEVADEAVIIVEDRGPGISPDELERVFAPFYRIEEGGRVQGVGLGLAIARSTARAHGGDVILRTSRQGVSAVVSLPLLSAAGRPA